MSTELQRVEDRADIAGLVMEWQDGGGLAQSRVIWRFWGVAVLEVRAGQC